MVFISKTSKIVKCKKTREGKMLKAILDGVDILYLYKNELLIFIVVAYGLGKIVPMTNDLYSVNKLLSALSTLPTGFTILSGAAFVFSFTTLISPAVFTFSSLLLTGISLLSLVYHFQKGEVGSNWLNILLITLFFFISLLLRLPYLNHILLPSYTDSPIHYQLIKNILEPTSPSPLMGIGNITNNYYHLGFHSMTAWLSAVTHTDPAKAMLFIGLLGLATAPISIAFITYILSRNISGALASGFVTVFGWTMPAFALNWGKFPALLALSLIPTVIGWGLLLLRSSKISILKIFFLSFMMLSIVVLHTRSIFILTSIAFAFFIANKLVSSDLLSYQKSFLYSVLFIFSLLPLESTIAVFYNRLILGIVIILLMPFGFRYYPKELSAIFIFTASIWLFEFLGKSLSMNKIAYDAQFIGMMLFIPFSVISGLGISGITKQFSIKNSFVIIGIFLLSASYNSPWNSSNFPDPCCDFYSRADEQAFQWIKNNTKEEALWVISVAENDRQHGTDAGIWINSLTNRRVNKRMYNTDWENKTEFPHSCNSGTSDIYIYSGGGIFSFNETDLLKLNWANMVYDNQSVKIYKILNCLN